MICHCVQASQGEQKKSSAAEQLPAADASPEEPAEVPPRPLTVLRADLHLRMYMPCEEAVQQAMNPGLHMASCTSAGRQGGGCR